MTSYKSSKTTKSPLSKKEAKSPEVSKPVKYKSEKQNEALTYLKKKVAAVEDTSTTAVASEKPTEDTDPENQMIPETQKNPENPMHPDNPETPVNDEPVETEAKEVTPALTEPGDAAAATEPTPIVEHTPANKALVVAASSRRMSTLWWASSMPWTSSSLTSAGTLATFSTAILGQLGIGSLGCSRLVVGGVVSFLLAGAWLMVVLRLVLVMSLSSLAWSWSS